MRDHQQQNPHLVQPQALPVAVEPVDGCVDRQAIVRRREGYDIAGEEGWTEDDVLSGRIESGVVRTRARVGQAVGVCVSTAIIIIDELFRCCYAEKGGRAIEREGCWRGQGDAGCNVCEESGYVGGVGRIFEECFVGGTWAVGVGVLNYREEGGVEVVEEVDDDGGLAPAVDNIVLAG